MSGGARDVSKRVELHYKYQHPDIKPDAFYAQFDINGSTGQYIASEYKNWNDVCDAAIVEF